MACYPHKVVVDTQKTRRDAVQRGAESLHRANPPFIGAVLNKTSAKGKGGYYYYYYSHSENDKSAQPRKRLGPLSKVFR